MRYGYCPVSFNGCEVIAVYNALKYLNKFEFLYKIIGDFEENRGIWLYGLFGTKPPFIKKYMKARGLKVKDFYLTKTMDKYIAPNRCFIVVYAHFGGFHTIMAYGRKDGGIMVYNRYGDSTQPQYVSSISKLVKTDGFKLIVGYWIY